MPVTREAYTVTCTPGPNAEKAARRLAVFIVQRWMTSCHDDPTKALLLAQPLVPTLTRFFQRERPTTIHVDTRSHRPTVTEVL